MSPCCMIGRQTSLAVNYSETILALQWREAVPETSLDRELIVVAVLNHMANKFEGTQFLLINQMGMVGL